MISAEVAETEPGDINPAAASRINKLGRASEEREIATVVGMVVEIEAMPEIFSILDELRLFHVPRLENTVTRAILDLMHDCVWPWMLSHHHFKCRPEFLSFTERSPLEFLDERLVVRGTNLSQLLMIAVPSVPTTPIIATTTVSDTSHLHRSRRCQSV